MPKEGALFCLSNNIILIKVLLNYIFILIKVSSRNIFIDLLSEWYENSICKMVPLFLARYARIKNVWSEVCHPSSC